MRKMSELQKGKSTFSFFGFVVEYKTRDNENEATLTHTHTNPHNVSLLVSYSSCSHSC